MSYKNILYEQEDHVVTITINRPEAHNCINNETNLELQDAWKTFRDDEGAMSPSSRGQAKRPSRPVGISTTRRL